MPTSLPARPLPPPSTTGIPEMRCSCIKVRASASVASGLMVTGLTTMPDSNFFTCRTCAACASGSRLRCRTPIPPACAMAIAICASVTVSIAEATSGMLSRMLGVMRDRISTSAGMTSERPGFNSTSSKVYASRGRSLEVVAIANSGWPEMADAARASGWSLVRVDSPLGPSSGPLLGWRRSIARLGHNS